jgi:hypothetical protein
MRAGACGEVLPHPHATWSWRGQTSILGFEIIATVGFQMSTAVRTTKAAGPSAAQEITATSTPK